MIGTEGVTKAVKDAEAKGNEAIGAAQKNLEARVDAARREVTRVEGLTLAQLNPQDASTVSSGTTTLQGWSNWISRQWEGFASSTVAKYLLIAAISVAAITVSFFATPAIGALLFYGGLALFILPTAANIGASTYWNMEVNGQGFSQALWGGITEGSTVGALFSAITNYDLTTMTYQGNSWQDRLGTLAEAGAEFAAARVGARFGKVATGQRCGFFKNCFVEGTPLLTPEGAKAIQDLKVGDYVMSCDETDERGEVRAKQIEEVFVRQARVLWLTIGGQRIGTTSEHPFWVLGKGWLPAGDAMPGDILIGHDGQQVVLTSKEIGEWATVYNMRIADWHTYFVGCAEWGFDVWAHNTDCASRYNVSTSGMSASEASAVREYASRTNLWIAQQPNPVIVQSTAGATRRASNAAARAERLRADRAGTPYSGQAGHVPDAAISGSANPPGGWLDMPGRSNSVVGGGLSSRIGQRLDVITVNGVIP